MLTVSEAAALLRSFDRVLILTHIRPDGDTVGCAAVSYTHLTLPTNSLV